MNSIIWFIWYRREDNEILSSRGLPQNVTRQMFASMELLILYMLAKKFLLKCLDINVFIVLQTQLTELKMIQLPVHLQSFNELAGLRNCDAV